MKRMTLIILLTCCTTAMGFEAPPWADPNQITGEILPWVPGDPNGWQAQSGKGVRVGTWQDPDGHAIDVNVPTGWSVEVTPTGYWTLSGDIKPGANYIDIAATDKPGPEYDGPITVRYTVLAWGLPLDNHGPILASTIKGGRLALVRYKQRLIQKYYKATGELLTGEAANAYVAGL